METKEFEAGPKTPPLPPVSPHPPSIKGGKLRNRTLDNVSVSFASEHETHEVQWAEKHLHPRLWHSRLELELFAMFEDQPGEWGEDVHLSCAGRDLIVTPKLSSDLVALRVIGKGVHMLHRNEEDGEIVYSENGGYMHLMLANGTGVADAKFLWWVRWRKSGAYGYFRCEKFDRS